MSAIVDITLHKKDVFVITRTNVEKSLTYQLIFKVSQGIVLVVSPTIAFMDDQYQWLCKCGISAVSLISTIVAEDPSI